MTAWQSTGVQRTTRLMWWFGAVSAVVSAGAVVQLIVLPTRTAELFAWTIAVPASAAFIGVFYLASAVMGVLALRQPVWAPARVALVPVVLFVAVVLVVTLLHLGLFHLGTGGFPARAAAWVWLVVYVVTPVGYLFAFWHQARAPGGPPPRTQPLSAAARWGLTVLGLLLFAGGLALLVLPQAAGPLWPWPLTTLTAQMAGATLLGFGLLAASIVRLDDRVTGRIAALGVLVGAVAAFVVGLVSVYFTEPSAWVYLVVCVLLALAAAGPARSAFATG
jgi:hypothetical protein